MTALPRAHGTKPRRTVRIDDDATVIRLAEHFGLEPVHVIDVHLVGAFYVFRVWSCTFDGRDRYAGGARQWHHVHHPTNIGPNIGAPPK